MINLAVAFSVNILVVLLIALCFYYPKSKRLDYLFTFILMSISIFLLIFVLNDVKMKTGFALGLFAIFSIIRYRTESMPVREMTYLFVIIATSVINAMIGALDWELIALADVLVIVSIGVTELFRTKNHKVGTKLIQYDRIDLIKPDQREAMIADLKERTGLEILNVEVGHIDFLKDMAMLKVSYVNESGAPNSVDTMTKFPKRGDSADDDD